MPCGPTGALSAKRSRRVQDFLKAPSASPTPSLVQPARSPKLAGVSTSRSGGPAGFVGVQAASAAASASASQSRRRMERSSGTAGGDQLPVRIARAGVPAEGPEVRFLDHAIGIPVDHLPIGGARDIDLVRDELDGDKGGIALEACFREFAILDRQQIRLVGLPRGLALLDRLREGAVDLG